jgi:hypothetical protein
MALIKIFSTTGIEIEYKKDSLTLKKENNSLSSDFKVPHSSFPFLVIENEVTKNVLGPSDITSIRKNKIVQVIILENGVRYYGELQQLSVIPKFRKCNLKYGSAILEIVNKKIAEFMPILSVIPGETNPVPFVEESDAIITGSDYWESFPVGMLGQIYPEAKFNFPTMYWPNKFGVELESTDPWYTYQKYINNFITNNSNQQLFVKNTVTISGTNVTISNKNVPSPQLFLLSPLYFIFNSINYNVKGNFVTNDFLRKLLMLSFKDNICKTYILKQNNTNVVLPALVFSNGSYKSITNIPTLVSGRYHFKLRFEEPQFVGPSPSLNYKRFGIDFFGPYGTYRHYAGAPATVYERDFFIDVTTERVGNPIYISYASVINTMPVYQFSYSITSFEQDYQQMHPTIELGRYAPDWSVGNYLNYIKNQFNLDITLDDFKKEVVLNFNEEILDFETPFEISKSLAMKSFDLAANSSFILKYENSEDTALFIDKNGVSIFQTQGDDYTQTIQSKFKYVKHNGNTVELSEDFKDLEGIGLMIYEPENAPNISLNAEGLNLKIDGAGGIYDKFFKKWLKFLLNASYCELSGFFTDIEVFKINNSKSVYVNNQHFRIVDIEITEASNNYQQVKMKLLSVNY